MSPFTSLLLLRVYVVIAKPARIALMADAGRVMIVTEVHTVELAILNAAREYLNYFFL